MCRRNTQFQWMAVSLMLLVMVAFFVGCSSKSVSDDVSDSTVLNVTASPSSVTKGATVVVEATIEDNASPVPNQVVSFSVVPSDAGYFSPSVDTTDADGVAASVFTAVTSGAATVTVMVNGSSLQKSTGISVVEVTDDDAGTISLNVTPSLLLANGADTSRISVTVRDAMSQPAPDSTVIKLVAGEKFVDIDGNGYWSAGIDSLVFDANANGQWDAIGLIPSTAFTAGGNGLASVDFVSGNDATTVYVKATVDDGGIAGSAETSLQLTPNASVNSIYMTSDSMQLSVKQTGGIESSLLRATGYDINGNTVPEGLTINFIITDGPGGGEHLGNVGYGPYVATTNSQGIATATIHSGTVSGTIRIRAYIDTVLSNATQVLISAGPPAYIVVGSEYCNIDYWDNVGLMVGITAVVSDIYLNPVNDSTVVYFSTDEGTMKSHELRTEDHEGIAHTKWIAGNNVVTADGQVIIMAETSGGTVAGASMFYNTHMLATLVVTGMPASMVADGLEEVMVRIDGFDLNGNPVIDGTKFKAAATYLSVAGGTLANGCGVATSLVPVTSSTLPVDKSTPGGNDDGIGAIDQVTYYAEEGSASTTVNVTLTTGIAYKGNSTIDVQTTAAPLEVVTISAVVKDRFGNPLGDHSLVLTVSDGVITPGTATQETNEYGEAAGYIWTAPNSAGSSATITLTDTDPRSGGLVLVKSVRVEI